MFTTTQPELPCRIFSIVIFSLVAGNQMDGVEVLKSGWCDIVYVIGISHLESLVREEFRKNLFCNII